MTITQKFEGPDMAALLDEVHTTLGPSARVIAANRCRSGGVAGFFARESYEVTVEIPDEAPRVSNGGARGRKRKRADSQPSEEATLTTIGSVTIDPKDSRSALEQLIDAADRADELAATPTLARAESRGAAASSASARTSAATATATPGSRSSATKSAKSASDTRSVSRQRRVSAANATRPAPRSGATEVMQEAAPSPRQMAIHDDFAAALDRAESDPRLTVTAETRSAPASARNTGDDGTSAKSNKSHRVFRRRSKTRTVEGPVDRIIDLSSFEAADVVSTLSPVPTRTETRPHPGRNRKQGAATSRAATFPPSNSQRSACPPSG